MIEYIITAGFLTVAGFVFQYKQHNKRMAKIKAHHEKEKHYLRRDQRARLKAAKARKKELDMIAKEKADAEAKKQEIKAISDTLRVVTKIGDD